MIMSFILGAVVGVIFMCILQAGKKEDDLDD